MIQNIKKNLQAAAILTRFSDTSNNYTFAPLTSFESILCNGAKYSTEATNLRP